MDIETRITMERGTSGFYTYDEYTHKASYPFIHRRRAVEEARCLHRRSDHLDLSVRHGSRSRVSCRLSSRCIGVHRHHCR